MTEQIIQGDAYQFTAQVAHDEGLRRSFSRLSKTVFGLDFEPWYQSGFWGKRFLPHALVQNGEVVANISVNALTFNLSGEIKQAIQLGTVMTHPGHRGRGLGRWLMEQILALWSDQCDAMYLYANDSVADFYPKFGFIPATEHEHRITLPHKTAKVRRLDMADPGDRALLLDHYRASGPCSAAPMMDGESMLMFYCGQFLKDCVYHLPEHAAVAVAQKQGDTLLCYDVFSPGPCDLHAVLAALCAPGTTETVLGFTPSCTEGFRVQERLEEDSTLFVLSGKENPFEKGKFMLPLLSHA